MPRVTGLLSGLTANWSVDAEGALIIDYPSGWRQKLQIVDTLGIEFGVLNEISRGRVRGQGRQSGARCDGNSV